MLKKKKKSAGFESQMMGRFIIDGPSSRNHKFSDEHFDIFYVLKSLQKQPLMALKI